MRPHLLVVQNAEHEGLGHLATAFEAERLTWSTVHAWEGDRVPSSLGDHLGLVLLGGPQSVYLPEQWPYLEREMALVREAHAIRAPVLGLCLGAQLVAQALGGRVHRGDRPEVGYAPLDLTSEGAADPLVGPLGGGAAVFHLHHDTYELPPGATRLASTPLYREQAFRVGDRTYGLQFHPEFTADMVERVLPGEGKDLAAAGVRAEDVRRQARELDAAMREAAHAVARGFAACGCFL